MSWWQPIRNDPIAVRLALPIDRAQVSVLLSGTWRRHGSLTLDDQATVLQSGLSTVAFMRQEAVGFLGVTARAPAGSPPEAWADINLVAIDADQKLAKILAPLLGQTLPALQAAGCTGLTCLTALGWLRNELLGAGFSEVDHVVSYTHSDPHRLPELTQVARLQDAKMRDVDTILALNAAAFDPFWRYGDATVIGWLLTADRATVAYLRDEPVGFALTARLSAGNFAHLNRVAVHPKAQGRGVGRQLVTDGLHYAYAAGAPGLALNTQASNAISRQLYESLGFRPADPVMSVLVYRL